MRKPLHEESVYLGRISDKVSDEMAGADIFRNINTHWSMYNSKNISLFQLTLANGETPEIELEELAKLHHLGYVRWQNEELYRDTMLFLGEKAVDVLPTAYLNDPAGDEHNFQYIHPVQPKTMAIYLTVITIAIFVIGFACYFLKN